MKYDDQLHRVLTATGWTQEQLAHKLGVSFATLNSWVNRRSKPHAKALVNIDKLYLDIVGVESADPILVETTKKSALELHTNIKQLLDDQSVIDKLTLYLTYHTNTIEGSTMTLADVEDVLFDNKVLANRTATEQAEARNHQAALHWLIDEIYNKGSTFVIDEDLICNINLRLMNGIIANAGQFRTHTVRISGAYVPLANWHKIPKLLDEFFQNLDNSSLDAVSLLARTHAQFEKIHPFSDGNGRAGRLLMFAQALKLSYIPPIVAKERKYAYYKYLEAAQTKDNYLPLEQFIAESMQFTNNILSA